MAATALTDEILTSMALSYLRVDADPITDLSTDTSKAGKLAKLWLPRVIKLELEAHPWSFARKHVLLTVADDGTGEPWSVSGDWERAYTAPSDMVTGRYFTTGDRGRTRNPWPWRPGVHDGTPVIFSSIPEAMAYFVYTFENTTYAQWPDAFGELVALALAVRISGPLLVNASITQSVQQSYFVAAQRAARIDGNASEEGCEPLVDLLRARD